MLRTATLILWLVAACGGTRSEQPRTIDESGDANVRPPPSRPQTQPSSTTQPDPRWYEREPDGADADSEPLDFARLHREINVLMRLARRPDRHDACPLYQRLTIRCAEAEAVCAPAGAPPACPEVLASCAHPPLDRSVCAGGEDTAQREADVEAVDPPAEHERPADCQARAQARGGRGQATFLEQMRAGVSSAIATAGNRGTAADMLALRAAGFHDGPEAVSYHDALARLEARDPDVAVRFADLVHRMAGPHVATRVELWRQLMRMLGVRIEITEARFLAECGISAD